MRAAKTQVVMIRSHGLRGRGFTLVELMIVVAVVGVLAAIALVGFRKYQISASSGEARAMLQNIRGGEDAYKAEVLDYLPCLKTGGGDLSNGANYYPRNTTALDSAKSSFDGWAAWGGTGPDCWGILNVHANGPVRYSFAAQAGPPGTGLDPGSPPGLTTGWPYTGFQSNNPWFVAAAVGNYDGDTIFSLLYTSSINGEVVVVEDTE